jgi:hypothetical protein
MLLPEETIIVTGFVDDVGRDIEGGLEGGAIYIGRGSTRDLS